MQTANPTAIDLDALAADLEAAGWAVEPNAVTVSTIPDYITARSDGYVINVFTDHTVYLGSQGGGYFNDPSARVFNVNPQLWHALDLIRTHTQEAPE